MPLQLVRMVSGVPVPASYRATVYPSTGVPSPKVAAAQDTVTLRPEADTEGAPPVGVTSARAAPLPEPAPFQAASAVPGSRSTETTTETNTERRRIMP